MEQVFYSYKFSDDLVAVQQAIKFLRLRMRINLSQDAINSILLNLIYINFMVFIMYCFLIQYVWSLIKRGTC